MHESIVVTGLILQAVTLLTLTFFLFQLLRQQGRILLRLDTLEHPSRAQDNHSNGASGPQELSIGTPIADFELPDLTGQRISLSHFRGRRVLLIYWSAECGFCDITAAELSGMQGALHENHIQLLLISYGDAEANRRLASEQRLTCPILLLNGSHTQSSIATSAFEYCGTPSAYLLDEDGKVSRALAAGMDAVLNLAREVTAKMHTIRMLPLTKSRIERNGLKKGAVAPTFSLPDLRGQIVTLDQFREQIVLLVFTDPQCGPCDQLAPQLARLHRKQGNKGLAIVMVGRGQAAQNTGKVMQHGIEFPVLLQERWKLSREYGIFDTPVAFLIDPNGIILRDVAKGPDEIMTLAHEGIASAKETKYAATV
jgi:peroxiredoxin